MKLATFFAAVVLMSLLSNSTADNTIYCSECTCAQTQVQVIWHKYMHKRHCFRHTTCFTRWAHANAYMAYVNAYTCLTRPAFAVCPPALAFCISNIHSFINSIQPIHSYVHS